MDYHNTVNTSKNAKNNILSKALQLLTLFKLLCAKKGQNERVLAYYRIGHVHFGHYSRKARVNSDGVLVQQFRIGSAIQNVVPPPLHLRILFLSHYRPVTELLENAKCTICFVASFHDPIWKQMQINQLAKSKAARGLLVHLAISTRKASFDSFISRLYCRQHPRSLSENHAMSAKQCSSHLLQFESNVCHPYDEDDVYSFRESFLRLLGRHTLHIWLAFYGNRRAIHE